MKKKIHWHLLCISYPMFNNYNSCLVVTTEDLYMCDLHQDNQYILLWAIIPVFGICCSINNLPASWNSYGNPRFIKREFQSVPQISGYKLYRLNKIFLCRCSIFPWVTRELETAFNFLLWWKKVWYIFN